MNQLSKGITYLFTITLLFVCAATLLFYSGMHVLEEKPISLIESLQFVTQTMTTVGYGEFAGWDTPLMQILVIVTEIAGIALVFLSIPIVVTPWIQERITLRSPTEYKGPANHIVIAEYTDLMETLLDELEDRDIPYVLIESDPDLSSELFSEDRTVIQGDPSEPMTLSQARIDEARLAILDGPDEQNAMSALAMDESNEDLNIVAVAGKENRAEHLNQAGVDDVIHPRTLIGQELARHALKAVGKELGFHDRELGKELDIREFPVLPSSPLIRESLKSAGIREQYGVNVVGVWRRGEFINHPNEGFRFRKGDIIVATGGQKELEQLEKETEVSTTLGQGGSRDTVIIGYGNEGSAARERLLEKGIEPTILNDIDAPEVDVVGNGMNPEALKKAEVDEAETVLITISSDEVTVMVTLMVRKLNPAAEILVQVNQEYTIEPIYRAGANYVQSLNLITGRMLAGQALGEDLLSPELNIKIRHCEVGNLAGQSLKESRVTEMYDISVIAIKPEDKVKSDFDPGYEFKPGDEVYICGMDDHVDSFVEEFAMANPE